VCVGGVCVCVCVCVCVWAQLDSYVDNMNSKQHL